MSDTSLTGGCACGALRYTAAGAPVAALHCQCRHCRMRSGTGHSSYLVFAGEGAVRLTGTPRTWRVAGDSGAEKIHAFCPTCGTPTHVHFAAQPGITAVHAGSLDAPEAFRPTLRTYAVRAMEWDWQDPALSALPEGPPG
ncbi:GFA family protein (plasmid) [Paroceanicella profunda]|uniref:GFA family protein n=1 Tax=Paroceanicella profunda TaxID=2579971 RepID=A0A5B8G360_9RHOB|nr:GFA family protein [Paroceanicella profunda]QDL94380.1 GFA family protein [Paroceanicella profunda]